MSDFAGAERIIATALKEFGAIDVLVNNAGILRDRMIFNMAEEDWDAVIAVHLKGTFNCTRHAAVHMRQQKRGRIISMSSTSGTIGNPGQANYGAAKDGIAAMTRVVSRELGKYGVTVNAVCPGASTRMTQTVGDSARQARQKAGIQTPAAPAATFTLQHTGPAKDVNGQVFFVMGGLVALMNEPAPVRTIFHDGRWTPEEIATVFSRTFGQDLVNPAPPKEPQGK